MIHAVNLFYSFYPLFITLTVLTSTELLKSRFFLKANIKVLSALHSINSVWHIFSYDSSYSFEITNVIVMQGEETHLKYKGSIFPLWYHLTDLFESIKYCKVYSKSFFFFLQLSSQTQALLGLFSRPCVCCPNRIPLGALLPGPKDYTYIHPIPDAQSMYFATPISSE